ncbi:hypothetical protein B0H10DRAFT_1951043 [Mycena sp. CBHHK59/15]|nr:hypothetical protein B0H10DRAFT_1951043 [Mycena sp. CBHHK59/15]
MANVLLYFRPGHLDNRKLDGEHSYVPHEIPKIPSARVASPDRILHHKHGIWSRCCYQNSVSSEHAMTDRRCLILALASPRKQLNFHFGGVGGSDDLSPLNVHVDTGITRRIKSPRCPGDRRHFPHFPRHCLLTSLEAGKGGAKSQRCMCLPSALVYLRSTHVIKSFRGGKSLPSFLPSFQLGRLRELGFFLTTRSNGGSCARLHRTTIRSLCPVLAQDPVSARWLVCDESNRRGRERATYRHSGLIRTDVIGFPWFQGSLHGKLKGGRPMTSAFHWHFSTSRPPLLGTLGGTPPSPMAYFIRSGPIIFAVLRHAIRGTIE